MSGRSPGLAVPFLRGSIRDTRAAARSVRPAENGMRVAGASTYARFRVRCAGHGYFWHIRVRIPTGPRLVRESETRGRIVLGRAQFRTSRCDAGPTGTGELGRRAPTAARLRRSTGEFRMGKFNTARLRHAVTSPIRSVRTLGGRTAEGAPGHLRTPQGELFLLAVSNMVGENTFYESAPDRDNRYAELVREVTLLDPEWTARFLGWLRGSANMRSAALVGAAEFTRARLDAGQAGLSRQVIDSVLRRADEPGELIAYWFATYGRALPKPIKRYRRCRPPPLRRTSADQVGFRDERGAIRRCPGSDPPGTLGRKDLAECAFPVRTRSASWPWRAGAREAAGAAGPGSSARGARRRTAATVRRW